MPRRKLSGSIRDALKVQDLIGKEPEDSSELARSSDSTDIGCVSPVPFKLPIAAAVV